MDMRLTLSAGRVGGVEDVWGDGVEILGCVVEPVNHCLHAFLVVLHNCRGVQCSDVQCYGVEGA